MFFKLIALVFCFFSYLILTNAFSSIGSSYLYHLKNDYIKTEGYVVSNKIIQNKDVFYADIIYEYTIEDTIYRSKLLYHKNLPVFYSFQDANTFASHFYTGKYLSFYLDKKSMNHYFNVGLQDRDIHLFFLYFPLFLISLFMVCLAFIDKWRFEQRNNIMGCLSYTLFTMSLVGIIIDILLIFYFKWTINYYFQIFFIVIYILSAIIACSYRKSVYKLKSSYSRYRRRLNTEQQDNMYLQPIYGIMYELKTYGYFPILSIAALSLNILLFSFLFNKNLFTKILFLMIICNVFLGTIYLYYLYKKVDFNRYAIENTMNEV